jgi:hypothetical protein
MGEICVFRLQARLICHGWVTPAARDARRSFAVKSDIRDAQPHVQPRAAGVSPPWRGECIQEHCAVSRGRLPFGAMGNTESGGPVGVVGRSCRNVRNHGGLTPPLLVAVAPWMPPAKIATYAMHKRTFTRAAGVSPPWLVVLRTLGCDVPEDCSDWRTSDQPAAGVAPAVVLMLRTLVPVRITTLQRLAHSDQERWVSARRGLGIALAETFDSRLANDATNDTGVSLPRGSKGGLLPTFGSQLRWVCLFVQRSRSICYRCSVRSCVPAGGSREKYRCWLRRNVE